MNRSIEELRQDFQLVSSNRFSSYQSKIFFIGVTIDLLLNTEIFKKNIELKPFVEKYYISNIIEEDFFKEYLYDSRTLLVARLSRLIFEKMNYPVIANISNDILAFLPESHNKKKKGKSDDLNKGMDEWLDYLGDKEKLHK